MVVLSPFVGLLFKHVFPVMNGSSTHVVLGSYVYGTVSRVAALLSIRNSVGPVRLSLQTRKEIITAFLGAVDAWYLKQSIPIGVVGYLSIEYVNNEMQNFVFDFLKTYYKDKPFILEILNDTDLAGFIG